MLRAPGMGDGLRSSRRSRSGAPRKRCDFDGESGTHSILDIFGTAEKREPFRAAPVPNDVLLATFGTTRPTREQLESCEESEPWQEFLAYLDRWEAFYFVVHKEGQPHEIVFEGCSGD